MAVGLRVVVADPTRRVLRPRLVPLRGTLFQAKEPEGGLSDTPRGEDELHSPGSLLGKEERPIEAHLLQRVIPCSHGFFRRREDHTGESRGRQDREPLDAVVTQIAERLYTKVRLPVVRSRIGGGSQVQTQEASLAVQAGPAVPVRYGVPVI
jgi:hypothetical protein